MVLKEAAAEASFAAILDLSKLGTAIAAMIRMIATTISSSINEKPFSFFILSFPSLVVFKILFGGVPRMLRLGTLKGKRAFPFFAKTGQLGYMGAPKAAGH